MQRIPFMTTVRIEDEQQWCRPINKYAFGQQPPSEFKEQQGWFKQEVKRIVQNGKIDLSDDFNWRQITSSFAIPHVELNKGQAS